MPDFCENFVKICKPFDETEDDGSFRLEDLKQAMEDTLTEYAQIKKIIEIAMEKCRKPDKEKVIFDPSWLK